MKMQPNIEVRVYKLKPMIFLKGSTVENIWQRLFHSTMQ